MLERMKLKEMDVPRVERAMTIWKKALNHDETEMPLCFVMDLMRGRQEEGLCEALESWLEVVVRGSGWG